jgi:putative ABC transport system permease protein
VQVRYQDDRIVLKTYDNPGLLDHYPFLAVKSQGSNIETGRKLFNGQTPTIVISESFSLRFQKNVGDQVGLFNVSGQQVQYEVVGVIRDFAGAKGVIYMDRQWYKAGWKDNTVNTFSVTHSKKISTKDFRAIVEEKFGLSHKLTTTSQADFLSQMEEILDTSFSLSQAVEWISLFVGLLGLLNSLMISTLQRKKELGLWRALGMQKSQLITTMLIESLLLSVAGLIVALTMGTVFSYLLITKNINYYLGWIIDFHLPPQSILTLSLVGIGLTLLTSLIPAVMAARKGLRESLAYE